MASIIAQLVLSPKRAESFGSCMLCILLCYMYAFTYFWMQTRTPHNKCQKASRKRVRNAISSCPCYKWWVPTPPSRDSSSSSSLFLSEAFYSSATCHGKRSKTMLHITRSPICLSVCPSVRPSVRLSQSVSKCWRPTHSPAKRYPSESRAGKPAASFFTRRLHNDWQFIMPASSLLGSFKASRSC